MSHISNPLDLYTWLEKSNCGRCLLPTCMAFAVAVLQGRKKLEHCPQLDQETRSNLADRLRRPKNLADDQAAAIASLQKEVSCLHFEETAARTQATLKDGMLAVNCLGKDFLIDGSGALRSDCHVNNWVHFPLLHYLLFCKGYPLGNDWQRFGDLQGAAQWSAYFSHRCETALQQLVDAHYPLMLEIFAVFGTPYEAAAGSPDSSFQLPLLPTVPLLINYWQEEDGFESQLNILFDCSAEHNMTAHGLTVMTRGVIEMFRQFIIRHSCDGRLFG